MRRVPARPPHSRFAAARTPGPSIATSGNLCPSTRSAPTSRKRPLSAQPRTRPSPPHHVLCGRHVLDCDRAQLWPVGKVHAPPVGPQRLVVLGGDLVQQRAHVALVPAAMHTPRHATRTHVGTQMDEAGGCMPATGHAVGGRWLSATRRAAASTSSGSRRQRVLAVAAAAGALRAPRRRTSARSLPRS